jgi:hypothetical protein
VSVPELDPEVEPELPLVPVEPLGFVAGLAGVAGVPVLMSLPASAARARGSVSPRRPCGEVLSVLPGDWLVLAGLPVSLPVFLQAPTPTINAAADANAISLRVIGVLFSV